MVIHINSEVGFSLFCQVTGNRRRVNVLQLQQDSFRLDIRKKFSGRVVTCWNRLPMEAVESLFLDVFKTRVDVVLKDIA